MKVPLLDLAGAHAAIRAEIDAAIAEVVDSNRFILGPQIAEFESALAEYCGVPEGCAVGMSSGTDALLVALMAAGVGAGDEVITTPFTFFATAGVIHRLGAKPVFVDIDPDTQLIDPAAVAAAVTDKTKVIVPVHIFGQCCDMAAIDDACGGAPIAVIEDACQAIGAEQAKRRAGSLGASAAFSFFPTKNLGGFGDSGAVTTPDRALADRLRSLRVHGESIRYHHDEVGINGRMDTLQAAVLAVKMGHLEEYQEARIANAARYAELFGGAGLDGTVKLPVVAEGNRHVYHQYVARAPRRDELVEHMRAADVGCAVYYPVPLHLQECFGYLGHKAGDLPAAEASCGEVIALPIYPDLTAEMQSRVVEVIAGFYG